jgi:hypothetical protein
MQKRGGFCFWGRPQTPLESLFSETPKNFGSFAISVVLVAKINHTLCSKPCQKCVFEPSSI